MDQKLTDILAWFPKNKIVRVRSVSIFTFPDITKDNAWKFFVKSVRVLIYCGIFTIEKAMDVL